MVQEFLEYARNNLDLDFEVVDIGCGLAGYEAAEIAPLFAGYSSNVKLSNKFAKIIG